MNNNIKPKGLKNLGLSCYMNSLLQCLFYIKDLREYFIQKKDDFNDNQPLCKALAHFMVGLKNEKEDYFIPTEFRDEIRNINKLFYDNKACDVKDLFINLIDKFLSELTNDSDNENNDENNDDEDEPLGKTRVFNMTQKEINKNPNIFNNLFCGYYSTSMNCKVKKKEFYSIQNESFMIFDLKNIYKNEKNLTIDACFKHFIKQKKTSYYCQGCKEVHEMESTEKIYKPPKILVIILDRGHGKTFTEKFVFNSEILDLKDYIDEKKNKYESLYHLIGVSTHSGSSSSSGHYTACCLADNKKYYYFSDTFVKEIDIKKNEEFYKDEPYILFYERIENNNKENENNITTKGESEDFTSINDIRDNKNETNDYKDNFENNTLEMEIKNIKKELDELNKRKKKLEGEVSKLEEKKQQLIEFNQNIEEKKKNLEKEKNEFEKYKSKQKEILDIEKENLKNERKQLEKEYKDKIAIYKNKEDINIKKNKNDKALIRPKGLKNLHSSCYINSLLQCFYYIKDLRNFFIINKNNFKDEQPLCKALAETMCGIKNEENYYFSPEKFRKEIKKINNSFSDDKIYDAKNLFINLLNGILGELNNNVSNNENDEENEVNKEPLSLSEEFLNIEKEVDKNIINDLFCGYYLTSTKCKKINKVFYSIQNETMMIFDLKNIYKNQNYLTIDSCFKYYCKPKKSSYYCPGCKKIHEMESKDKIYRPPKILVLTLDRGNGKTFTEKFEFNSEILDLKDYIDEKDYKLEGSLYQLIGTTNHSGSSYSDGHYTACCLTDNDKYYYFDDINIKEINEKELYKDEPYILFYQRIDANNEQNESININEKELKDKLEESMNYFLKNKNSNNINNSYIVDYYYLKEDDNFDPFIWKLIIKGPKETPYENGNFIFKLDFHKNYKENLSDITTLETSIYHLNFENNRLLHKYKYNNDENLLQNLYQYFNFIYNLFKQPNKSILVKYTKEKILDFNDHDNYKNKAIYFTSLQLHKNNSFFHLPN